MAEKNKKTKRKIVFPEKREINLAIVGKQKMNVPAAVLGSLLIIGAAALFSKFGVMDRFTHLREIQHEEHALREQVEAINLQLKDFDEISEEYEHYTYTGMTKEELTRSDRMDVVNLLNEKVFPYVTVDYWTLQGNVLFIPMNGDSLQQINQIVQILEADPRVDFCTVNTAVTEERIEVIYPETEAVTEADETEEPEETDEEAQSEASAPSDETEMETETETETETEEPQPIYETVIRVKGKVTCYLKPQENEFIGLEVPKDESTES